MKYWNDYTGTDRLARDRIEFAIFHFENGDVIKIDDICYFDTKSNSDTTLIDIKLPLSPTYYFRNNFIMKQRIMKIEIGSIEYDINDCGTVVNIRHNYEGNFVVEFVHEFTINDGRHYDTGVDITLIEKQKRQD